MSSSLATSARMARGLRLRLPPVPVDDARARSLSSDRSGDRGSESRTRFQDFLQQRRQEVGGRGRGRLPRHRGTGAGGRGARDFADPDPGGRGGGRGNFSGSGRGGRGSGHGGFSGLGGIRGEFSGRDGGRSEFAGRGGGRGRGPSFGRGRGRGWGRGRGRGEGEDVQKHKSWVVRPGDREGGRRPPGIFPTRHGHRPLRGDPRESGAALRDLTGEEGRMDPRAMFGGRNGRSSGRGRGRGRGGGTQYRKQRSGGGAYGGAEGAGFEGEEEEEDLALTQAAARARRMEFLPPPSKYQYNDCLQLQIPAEVEEDPVRLAAWTETMRQELLTEINVLHFEKNVPNPNIPPLDKKERIPQSAAVDRVMQMLETKDQEYITLTLPRQQDEAYRTPLPTHKDPAYNDRGHWRLPKDFLEIHAKYVLVTTDTSKDINHVATLLQVDATTSVLEAGKGATDSFYSHAKNDNLDRAKTQGFYIGFRPDQENLYEQALALHGSGKPLLDVWPAVREHGVLKRTQHRLRRLPLDPVYGHLDSLVVRDYDLPPPALFSTHYDTLLLTNLHPSATTAQVNEMVQPFCADPRDLRRSVEFVRHPLSSPGDPHTGRAYVGFDRPHEAATVAFHLQKTSQADFPSIQARRVHDDRLPQGQRMPPRSSRPGPELVEDLFDGWERHVDPEDLKTIAAMGVDAVDDVRQKYRKMRQHTRTYGPVDQARLGEREEPEREPGSRLAEGIRMYAKILASCATSPEEPGDYVKAMFMPEETVDIFAIDDPELFHRQAQQEQ